MGFRLARTLAIGAALLVCASARAEDGAGASSEVTRQHEAVQQRMLNDPEVMRGVEKLRDDPAVQAILSDPAIADALERGDLSALLADPKIRRLAEDPTVQSITRQVTE
jgi:hypothetical protein